MMRDDLEAVQMAVERVKNPIQPWWETESPKPSLGHHPLEKKERDNIGRDILVLMSYS
jgi:hypothetical protein